MKLERNFYLAEFTDSFIASRLGLSNDVPGRLMGNLRRLAKAMQHVRDFLGHPVIITSGYRSPAANAAVDGSVNSQHMKAAAADWSCPGFGTPLEVCRAIEPHLDQFGITQLIHEYGAWIHTGILPVEPINRVLTYDRGVPRARPGLHSARK